MNWGKGGWQHHQRDNKWKYCHSPCDVVVGGRGVNCLIIYWRRNGDHPSHLKQFIDKLFISSVNRNGFVHAPKTRSSPVSGVSYSGVVLVVSQHFKFKFLHLLVQFAFAVFSNQLPSAVGKWWSCWSNRRNANGC